MTKKCEIYDRDCIDCGECMFCDLDPTKICDNCGKCIDMGDYYTIKIDKIETSGEEAKGIKRGKRNPHVRGKI